MLQIPAVFSDKALFQHSAGLTIRGTTDSDAQITLGLYKEEKLVIQSVVTADHSGRFSLSFSTPPASFATYRCEITNGQDKLVLNDWLFGELWMAAGQSNMDMAVEHIPEEEQLRACVANKVMRFYRQGFGDLAYLPSEPEDTVDGVWCTDQDDLFRTVSALGTRTVAEIYDYLNREEETIPVGLINCNMGATFIENWLPREAVEQDAIMNAYLSEKKRGLLPFGQPWNGYGGENYRQPYGLYNRKVAALIGIQLRGILWYQGESNVGGRESAAHYKRALLMYQRVYESLFRADGCAHLPVICVQIFTFIQTFAYPSEETLCRTGFFNESFVEAAKEAPDKIFVVPTYDLPANFAPYSKKVYPHPIHPMHKYALGTRLGQVANAAVYGGPGPKTAAYYASSRVEGDSLLIKIETDGRSLTAGEKGLRGFCICGKSEIYQEANAEIVGADCVRIWHPLVKEPCFATYQYDDMATGGSLYCGGLPVAAFATDRESDIHIAPKPWLHTEQNACLVQMDINDSIPRMDFFPHRLWHPMYDSELCTDDINCLTKGALRIYGNSPHIGAYVRQYPGYPLDLQNYRALRFSVFHYEGAKLTVAVRQNSCLKSIPLTSQPEDAFGWTAFEADLYDAGVGEAEELLFMFDVTEKKLPAVNLDALTLIALE